MKMQYRTFQKTGEKVSLLGFGTMRLPVNPDYSVNETEAIRMIRAAIDSGVNYVDTAYNYHGGNSETVLGKALGDGYREKVLLADKMPVWMAREDADLQKIFDEQLARLGVQVIDMYLIHNITVPNYKLVKKYNLIEFLERKKAEGKIKHIGFSFHDSAAFFKEIIDSYKWDFCQIQLNYMDAEFQAGVEGLKYAASKGIPTVVMEPLKGGLLTDGFPESVERLWSEADTKRTPAEWAMRWVADFPEVLTILSGMSTMEQVAENIRILNEAEAGSLTEKERRILGKVAAAYNDLIQYPCTACNYCVPCPQKIQIPLAMRLCNEWFAYAHSPKTKGAFNMWFTKGRFPSDCTKCKACEEKCPQHLNITEMLEKAAEIFEAKE